MQNNTFKKQLTAYLDRFVKYITLQMVMIRHEYSSFHNPTTLFKADNISTRFGKNQQCILRIS